MDVLSSKPLWPIRDGLPASFPPLETTTACDVAIIGGGITGAVLARVLTTAGFQVIVLDRREVAHGSTAGNTGLLLYELDRPLWRLSREFGPERAARAYRRCRDAVLGLVKLVRESGAECGLVSKRSVYVAASRAHLGWLRREFELRRDLGLDVAWWSRARLAAESSLPHLAAIVSREAAQVDAYRMTYGLLVAAQRDGAHVHDRTEVTRWKLGRTGVVLHTSRGARVRARHLVVATGYEAEEFLPLRYGQLHSTYALASEPVAEFRGWPADRAMIWDTADPYLYLRTTSDRRVIIGGYDEPFRDPLARDRRLKAKTVALQRRFRRLFPRIPLEVATAWAGTFGTTRDGLPLIGRHPDVPHTWFALGFGGNGTTCSLIAAESIRAELRGERDPDAELFGFERLGGPRR